MCPQEKKKIKTKTMKKKDNHKNRQKNSKF